MSRKLLSLLLLGILATAALAQETPRKAPLFPDDERLDEIIPLHAAKWSLWQVCTRIGEGAGARIVTDRNLVDEPMMISVAAQPAREIMAQIADLFHYAWLRRGKEGEWQYILAQTLAAQEEERRARDGAELIVEQALREELDKRLQAMNMPQDQLQARVAEADQQLAQAAAGGLQGLSTPAAQQLYMAGQVLRDAADPARRSLLELVGSFTPAQWNALRDLGGLSFSTNPGGNELPLPGAVSTVLANTTPSFPFPKALFQAMGPDVLDGLAKAEKLRDETWQARTGIRVVVRLDLSAGEQPVGMLTVTPVPLGQGNSAMFAMSGLSIGSAPLQLAAPMGDEEARQARLAADPVLGKKATLDLPQPETEATLANPLAAITGAPRSGDLMALIADTFHVNMIGDAYTRQALAIGSSLPANREAPLYEVLDAYAGITRTWEWDGNFVRLRSKTWAFDKHAEVPPRMLRAWAARRAQQGRWTLDDLAEMAVQLRDEQADTAVLGFIEIGMAAPDLFQAISPLLIARDMLRIYGRLIPGQRQRLLAGGSLPVAQMFPYQREMVLNLNIPRRSSTLQFFTSLDPPRSPAEVAQAVLQLRGPGPGTLADNAQPDPAYDPRGMQIWQFRLLYPQGPRQDTMVSIPPVTGYVAPEHPGAAAPEQ